MTGRITTEQILMMGISAGYNADLAMEVGIIEAIILNRLVYLHRNNSREDGFTWHTSREWKINAGLSDYQVRRAMNRLVDLGYIEVKNTYIAGTRIKCRHHRLIFGTPTQNEQLDSKETKELDSKETKELDSKETKDPIIYIKHNIRHNIKHNIIGAEESAPEITQSEKQIIKKKPTDEVAKTYYETIKTLKLPVRNHNNVRTKINQLKQELGKEDSLKYLQFIIDIYPTLPDDGFKPRILEALDIYSKRVAIGSWVTNLQNKQSGGIAGW